MSDVARIEGGKRVGTCPECNEPTYVNLSKQASVKSWVHSATGSAYCGGSKALPSPPPPGLSTNPDGSIDYRCINGPFQGRTVRVYGGDTEFVLPSGTYTLVPPAGRQKKFHFTFTPKESMS